MYLLLHETQIVPTFRIFHSQNKNPYLGPRVGAGPRLVRPQWSYPVHSTFHFIVLFTNRVKSIGQIRGRSQSGPSNVEQFLDQSPPWRPPLLSCSCPLNSSGQPPWLLLSSLTRADGSWGNRVVRGLGPSVCVNLSSDHTHDFLLYLGVLSINVGIAHLPILISAKDRASVSTRGSIIPKEMCFKTWPFHPKVKDFVTALQDKGTSLAVLLYPAPNNLSLSLRESPSAY